MNSRTPSPLLTLLKPVLIGLCVGAVAATGLLLLSALLVYKLTLPAGALPPIAVTAVGLGCFCGGLAVGLSAKENGLFAGALCGTLTYLVLLIAGLAYTGDAAVGYAALKWAVMTVCSAAGGVVGVNRR